MADYINKWNVNGVYYNIQDHDRGLPGGVATLDLNGRIPIAQLPETSINYRGTWNALTNTPTLADGTGTQGDMYFVSTSGTWKGEQWYIGDRVIYNGTVWQRVPSSGVNSVNGKDGEVVLYGTDINMSANEATTIEAKINGLNATNPTASGVAEVVVTDITQDKGKISATRKNLPTVTSPTASGNALAFIDAVSQTNGKITATKKNIQDSSTTQKGVVQLTSAYTATDEAKATNGKALAAMLTTLKVDDPEAEGTATEVITSISQTNGKITATKKLLPSGGVQWISIVGSARDVYSLEKVYTLKELLHISEEEANKLTIVPIGTVQGSFYGSTGTFVLTDGNDKQFTTLSNIYVWLSGHESELPIRTLKVVGSFTSVKKTYSWNIKALVVPYTI